MGILKLVVRINVKRISKLNNIFFSAHNITFRINIANSRGKIIYIVVRNCYYFIYSV